MMQEALAQVLGLQMLDLATAIVFLSLFLYVLFINYRSPLNRSCAYLLLSFSVWSLSLVFLHNPNTPKDLAVFYYNLGCLGWASFGSLTLYFTLVFRGNKDLTSNLLLKLVLFLCPAIVIWSQWTGRLWADYVLRPWGWSYIWQAAGWPFFFYAYVLIFVISGFTVVGYCWLMCSDRLKRGQAFMLLWTGLLSLAFAFMVDIILPRMGVYSVPNVAPTCVLIFAFGLIYAITKYRLILTERELTLKAEKQWEMTFDAIEDGIAIHNLDYAVIDANSALCRLLNRKREDLIGRKGIPLLHSALLEKMYRAGIVEEAEFFEAGLQKWFHLSAYPVYDDEKKLFQAIQVVRDITEHKKLEEAVSGSRKFLDHIINAVGNPVFVKDRQHRWVLLNDAYCAFMGYKREELLGKSDREFFPKNEADIFWEKDEVVFKTRKTNENEESFTDAAGQTHTILTKKELFKDDKGEDYLVGIIFDLTERKRMENALEKEKVERETLLDAVPNWIFYKDDDNRFLWVNKTYSDAFGQPKEKLIGKSLFDLFPREQAAAFWRDDKEVIASGQPKRNIVEPADIKGKTLWFQTDKMPYRDESGKIVGVIGFAMDITQFRDTEMALREWEKKYGAR